MDVSALQARFGIPGVLGFDEEYGLARLSVRTRAATGSMFLQGAHLAQWQPAGQEPVIFLSRKSEFAPGKPIRGGVPIAFPWFASDSKKDRVDGHPGPGHGFARLQEWTLESARQTGDGLNLKLSLGPSALSRTMGYDHFLLTYEVNMGADLGLTLTCVNTGSAPLEFEEAFHSYFSVVDIHEATVTGLEPTGYFDKTDNMAFKPATGRPIAFSGPVDRMYQDTETPLTIHDGTQRRDIRIVKRNSRTTVVWNPWKAMADLGEWDWHEMVCVETVNAGKNAVTLAPGQSWSMGATVTVQRWKA